MAEPGLSPPPTDLNPPTSEPEEVYESDGANTENAPVDLGALDSAVAQDVVLPKSFKTPVRSVRGKRRVSARRTPVHVDEIMGQQPPIVDELRNLDPSPRAATPDQATIFEEPSSVLGSKVLRALDNPSPPPQFANLPSDTEEETDEEWPLDAPLFDSSSASISARRKSETSVPDVVLLSGHHQEDQVDAADIGRASPPDQHMMSPPTGVSLLQPEATSPTLMHAELSRVEEGASKVTDGLHSDPAAHNMVVDEAPETVKVAQSEPANVNGIPIVAVASPAPSPPASSPDDNALEATAAGAEIEVNNDPMPPTPTAPTTITDAEHEEAEMNTLAAFSTPDHPPPRRSARLSATPRATPPTGARTRKKRASSPLKRDGFLATTEETEAPPEPRPLNIVKKSAKSSDGYGTPCASTPVTQNGQQLLAPPSSARTRRKGKSRSTSPNDMVVSGDESSFNSPTKPSADQVQGPVEPTDGPFASPGKVERRRTKADDRPDLHRNLSSLSPGSASLLSSLFLSDEKQAADPIQPVDVVVNSAEVHDHDPGVLPDDQQIAVNVPLPETPPQPDAPFTPPRQIKPFPTFNPKNPKAVLTPARMASPSRRSTASDNAGDGTAAGEVPRTPARRVLVAESGYQPAPVIIQNGRLMPTTPQQRPAAGGKQVPASPAYMSLPAGVRKPARVPLPTPALGAVSEASTALGLKNGVPPASPVKAGSSRTPVPHPALQSRIPSPVKQLRQVSAQQISAQQAPTPQESGSDDSAPPSYVPPSTARQTAQPTTSRIPRIGMKPYSRPTPVASKGKDKEDQVVVSQVSDDGIESVSMDEGHDKSSTSTSGADAMIAPGTAKHDAHDQPRRPRDLTAPTASSLKRKRETEEARTALPRATPRASVSKIPSSIPSRSRLTPLPSLAGKDTIAPSARTAPGVRRVAGAQRPWVDVDDEMVEPTSDTATPIPTSIPPTAVMSHAAPEHLRVVELPAAQPGDEQPATGRSARRTARGRKASEPASEPPTDSLRPTRRRSATPKPIFGTAGVQNAGGLTNVALQALTLKNTERNQHYYATLETHIVRRDGNRPESPGMKVRTIAQRLQDEKEQGRAVRAERRARRSSGSAYEEGDSWVEDSIMDDDEEEVKPEEVKHRRGAGEVEDYETPVKPLPGLFGAGMENGQVRKGIKWDKMLFTEVYIDEILPQPPKPAPLNGRKGCLTHRAKDLRLDGLGNLVDTTAPLPPAPDDNIVVKKFVYDDDMAAPESEPEPAPPPPKRSNRRKSAETDTTPPAPEPAVQPKRVSRRKSKT